MYKKDNKIIGKAVKNQIKISVFLCIEGIFCQDFSTVLCRFLTRLNSTILQDIYENLNILDKSAKVQIPLRLSMAIAKIGSSNMLYVI